MYQDGPSYLEGRLKQQIRRRFASGESRAGLSKKESVRECRALGAYCVLAGVSFVGVVGTTEAGCALWAQLLALTSLVFWCGLGGLVDTASAWQREYIALLIERACRD